MSDVRTVFTTTEVAKVLDVSTSYLLRLIQEMDFNEKELRKAGKGGYLFSVEALKKLKSR